MKYTRIFALLLVVVMLTSCGQPVKPVATVGPSEQTLPPETGTFTEATFPDPTGTQTQPTETTPLDIQPPADDALVKIADYIPNIAQELHYATQNNFTGKVVYEFTDAYLRYGTVKKLAAAQEILNGQGLGLKIWDGFRPVYAQAKLFEAWPDPNYVSHPVTGYRAHCRGNAADVTLIDLKTGEELEMPTGFDDFSAKADRDYADCTEIQTKNAKILEDAMVAAGLTPYSAEWWHYTDPVDYAVDEYFDPAVISPWVANCNEYINLRTEPDSASESLAKIPNGEIFTLLGWAGRFAYVDYQGTLGFVLSSYIQPEEKTALSIVAPTDTYSYEQMLSDIAELAKTYPDAVTAGSIGTSEEGREIPVLLLGNPEAKVHVLVQGTVHAREHMCAWVLMAMAERFAPAPSPEVCVHLIPMANPDGVVLCQSQSLTAAQKEIYESDKEVGYTTDGEKAYALQWKANGLGVDINRNFDAGWDLTASREAPSSQQYKGDGPFSCAEAAALRDYTLKYDFAATVSYHATGSVIYWEYGDRKEVNDRSYSLGQALGTVTGYPLIDSEGVDAAGYKDWAIDVLGIPSVTVEIGCGELPLAYRELHSILERNIHVLSALGKWAAEG